MPWFAVDDRFHAHRKAARAGAEALGLWLLAGSWSAGELTDGWIPDYVAARLDPKYRKHAAALVSAGLWLAEERDGEKGWQFHQWNEYQPSAAEVSAKRAEARERMRRVREKKRASSEDVRANTSRTDSEVRSAPIPVPNVPNGTSNGRERPETDPPDFQAFWDAYPRKEAKGAARRAWTTATKKADPALITKAASLYAASRERENPRYTALPASWLNAERWTDQPPPNPQKRLDPRNDWMR